MNNEATSLKFLDDLTKAASGGGDDDDTKADMSILLSPATSSKSKSSSLDEAIRLKIEAQKQKAEKERERRRRLDAIARKKNVELSRVEVDKQDQSRQDASSQIVKRDEPFMKAPMACQSMLKVNVGFVSVITCKNALVILDEFFRRYWVDRLHSARSKSIRLDLYSQWLSSILRNYQPMGTYPSIFILLHLFEANIK